MADHPRDADEAEIGSGSADSARNRIREAREKRAKAAREAEAAMNAAMGIRRRNQSTDSNN